MTKNAPKGFRSIYRGEGEPVNSFTIIPGTHDTAEDAQTPHLKRYLATALRSNKTAIIYIETPGSSTAATSFESLIRGVVDLRSVTAQNFTPQIHPYFFGLIQFVQLYSRKGLNFRLQNVDLPFDGVIPPELGYPSIEISKLNSAIAFTSQAKVIRDNRMLQFLFNKDIQNLQKSFLPSLMIDITFFILNDIREAIIINNLENNEFIQNKQSNYKYAFLMGGGHTKLFEQIKKIDGFNFNETRNPHIESKYETAFKNLINGFKQDPNFSTFIDSFVKLIAENGQAISEFLIQTSRNNEESAVIILNEIISTINQKFQQVESLLQETSSATYANAEFCSEVNITNYLLNLYHTIDSSKLGNTELKFELKNALNDLNVIPPSP